MGKIVYVVETYTDGLGYIDNVLPAELAARGHEVSVVTARLPAYYQSKTAFFGSLTEKSEHRPIERVASVDIYTLQYRNIGKRILFKNIYETLKLLNPEVVMVRGLASPVLLQVILSSFLLQFRTVTSTGRAYSSIPRTLTHGKWFARQKLKNYITNYFMGRCLSTFVYKCIASTEDGRDAAVEFYGVQSDKTIVIKLGVDTTKFTPALGDLKLTEERAEVRRLLGIKPHEILCVWSGRMTKDKGLLLLAKSIEELVAAGHPYRCLFIGAGEEYEALRAYPASVLHPFVKWTELPRLYRACDISVWPSSITTSTLDASACGLPVVMSSEERAIERWSGIGESYQHLNAQSLKDVLLKFSDTDFRQRIGEAAVRKMRNKFSWKKIAEEFESALFPEK